MSGLPKAGASSKTLLVSRSRQSRLRLGREALAVADSLHWKRAVVSVTSTPAARKVALGLLLAIAGPRRTGRIVSLAGRALFFAGLARTLFSLAAVKGEVDSPSGTTSRLNQPSKG